MSEAPSLVSLDDEEAVDIGLVGGKAAALARVRSSGVRTLGGVVLTTELSARYDQGCDVRALPEFADAFEQLSAEGRPVVVRSSSVTEDGAASSSAGQYDSVVGVRGSERIAAAVVQVLESRSRAGTAGEPIAVLVQPMVEPDYAGVFFGVDPVSGRSDRRVIAAVRGLPEALVSGSVEGSRWTLDESGSVLGREVHDGVELPADVVEQLHGTGERLAETFGGPQDVEWAVLDDELIVLQSRPVTSEIRGVPQGPAFGPGPVAETFPEALSMLERDLWVPPLREGLREALRILGATPARELDERELVVTIDGRVALDLEVSEPEPNRAARGVAARVRRLRSSWRIGRLRVALPQIADALSARVDSDLEQVPELGLLSSRQLVAVLGRSGDALKSLHGHEILMGVLSDPAGSGFTGASVALRVLAEGRIDGMDDEAIVRHAPVVLALVAPKIGAPLRLPDSASLTDIVWDPPHGPDLHVRREALRLRVRWMQELVAQVAVELGRRLVRRDELPDAAAVRHLRLDELTAVVTRRASVLRPVVDARCAEGPRWPGAPLPSRFRLSDRGRPISEAPSGRGGGTGAGGGRAVGVVSHDADDPPPDAVLVVGSLTPSLGPMLPRLRAIVCETGSVLSHLAILARESEVAVVVGHHGAAQELRDGAMVEVDGQSGAVRTLDEEDGA